MEERAKNILKMHGCKFLRMLSECEVLWENKNGIIRHDDIFVLNNMGETAWEFWANTVEY